MLIVNVLKYTLMQKQILNCRGFQLRSAGLIRLATHLLKQGDQVLQKHFGISHAQLQVLMLVECSSPISQRELAQSLNLTQAAVSRLTDTLLRKKLINRVEDPENRRTNKVTLTPEGQSMIEDAFSLISELEKKLYDSISPRDLATWLKTTAEIQSRLP